jgi:hypothetical protein
LKTIRIYLLPLIVCFITSATVKAQFILPTLQASAYVPIKVEIKVISEITDNDAKAMVVMSASTTGRTTAGVCWQRDNPNPTIANDVAFYNGTNLTFLLTLSSGVIRKNRIIYARPFVTIGGITTYGQNVVFNTTDGNNTPTDGKLNFVTMNTPGGQYSDNEEEFDSQIAPGYGNVIQTGVADISVLLDFTNRSKLNAAGISVTSNGERFSIVSSGFFIPSETGTYLFTCEGDDAVDLFVNGVNVANHYGGHGVGALGSHTGTISLTAGTKYSFRARIQEFAGQEGLRVFWRKPSQSGSPNWFQDVNEVSSY